MKAVYVTQPGATLGRRGGLFEVRVAREVIERFAADEVDQLVLMGNVVPTPAALDLVMDRGVDAVFLSTRGRFRGRIVGGPSRHIDLRMRQYRFLSDAARVVDLARRIVAGKIANHVTLLLRHRRRHGGGDPQRRAIVAMRALARRVEMAETLDEARGFEGAAQAAYFGVFDGLIRADGFAFEGRNRRPPLDPVNALLSLGYTLLATAVHGSVGEVGLDPYLGALHGAQTGRPSLVLDLMEEWRAPLVDALVLAAINKRSLRPGDFEEVGPGEPVIIRRDGVRWFVTLFERRLAAQVTYRERRLTYRQVLVEQARLLARLLRGEEEAYEPFRHR